MWAVGSKRRRVLSVNKTAAVHEWLYYLKKSFIGEHHVVW